MAVDLIWGVILITATGLLVAWKQSLGRPMFWGALVSLPILLLPVIFFGQSAGFGLHRWQLEPLAWAVVQTLLFGALAAGGYEWLLHRHLALAGARRRRRLIWLLVGPFLLALALFSGQGLVFGLTLALAADLIALLVLRTGLVWDVLFGALAMALLYGVMYCLFWRNFSSGQEVWFGHFSGLTAGGVTIEQLVATLIYGALWGPIYIGLKDIHVQD